MNALVISYIRTGAALLAGVIATWLATHLNVVLDDNTQAMLAGLFTAVAGAVYYGVVRALESRWPKLGFLLGVPRTPDYGPKPAA